MKKVTSIFLIVIALIVPLLASAEDTCESETIRDSGSSTTLKLKLAATFSILIAGAIGVSLPIIGKRIPTLHPESNVFFLIKAFAAGIILSTGFVHVLSDASESLTSPCLGDFWTDFPFTGMFAMLASILTYVIDTTASNYYKKTQSIKAKPVNGDVEMHGEHEGHLHVHDHASHGHAHGSSFVVDGSEEDDHLRHRIIAKVLEVGIVIHSVVIGISMGASQSSKTIKPLVAALTFHQFFEGMGLGGCISQANFKAGATTIMILFFSLTTPVGIGIGMGISSRYNESSVSALLCEGILNSLSAAILIYMALVDLLAADAMHPKMQANLKLHLASILSLVLGGACMTLLAKWA